MNYVPFVYLLRFKPTGQYYIGSHYANSGKRIAHPSRLWKSYFTHSDPVKKLIKEHGKDAFEFEIRKTFSTREETLAYEIRFLRRVDAKKNPMFLNESNGAMDFSGPHTEETNAKRATTRSMWSEEKKEANSSKISNSLMGQKHSAERRANISAGRNGRTQEEKDVTVAKWHATQNAKTQEEKDAFSAKLSAAVKDKTQEEKAAIAAKLSTTRSSKTQEEKDTVRANMSAAQKGKTRSAEASAKHCATLGSKTQEEKDAAEAKRRVTRNNRTQEERDLISANTSAALKKSWERRRLMASIQ